MTSHYQTLTETINDMIDARINELLHPTVEIVTSNPVPSLASEFSAGYDLRADLWNIKEKFLDNTDILKEKKTDENGDIYEVVTGLCIHPGGHCLVPTGIFTAFPGMYEAQIRPRSGNALKCRITITNSPGTIEGDYKDEWGVIIDNEGHEDFIIRQGDKICQAVFSLVVRPNFVKKDSTSELSGSNRGGGFGHSGK